MMIVYATAVACGGSDGSSSSGTTPVSQAQADFCNDLGNVIRVVDQFGRTFQRDQVTTGDLKTSGSELAAAQASVESSANQLADAIETANRVATAGTGSTTTITVLATKSADDHLQSIRRAQRDFDARIEGVDSSTPVVQAAQEMQAAGFGLEQAYVSLFVDAGCLATDADAASTLNAYVTALQQDLTSLGYYTAAIDGIYGPDTVTAVKALQSAAGLPQSGVMDPATERAMTQQLAAKGQQQALNIAALQGALTVTGYYQGPIDGIWSPAVESALTAYQTDQNLPPAGGIDAATLAALLNPDRPADSASTTTSAPGSTTTNTPTSTTVP